MRLGEVWQHSSLDGGQGTRDVEKDASIGKREKWSFNNTHVNVVHPGKRADGTREIA